jgi:long-chain-alcohol oxidase
MELTPRQRRSLEAICETFCPPANGLPGARELGVPEAVLALVGRDPRSAARRELKQLLGLWDTAPLTALGGGGLHRFSELPREQREQVLLSWCDSRLPQRRAAFHALRKASLLTYYGLPAPDGGPSPVWDAIGYRGRSGRATTRRPSS